MTLSKKEQLNNELAEINKIKRKIEKSQTPHQKRRGARWMNAAIILGGSAAIAMIAIIAEWPPLWRPGVVMSACGAAAIACFLKSALVFHGVGDRVLSVGPLRDEIDKREARVRAWQEAASLEEELISTRRPKKASTAKRL